jgi:hypothetical protein
MSAGTIGAHLVVALVLAAQSEMQQDPSSAYHDAAAPELVRLARARRTFFDRSITSYDAIVKELGSVGLRLRSRDRMAYRRATASRIEW